MKKPNIADTVARRDRCLQEMGASFTIHDSNGLRRIPLGTGGALDVWVTTGSWNVVGTPDFHKNDWEGAMEYLALRL